MILSKNEDLLYKILSLYSDSEKPLSLLELVEQAKHSGKVFNLTDDEINKVIEYYQQVNGISKADTKILKGDNLNENWFLDIIDKNKTTYLDRYLLFLKQKKKFSSLVVGKLKKELISTCKNFADPNSTTINKTKGLVVGDVQSGKTANYIGLINLSVDIGYKNIILLTGTTENLRNQTQKRVDDGFIGAKSNTIAKQIQYTGVGENEYYAITFTDEDKDFLKSVLDSTKVNGDDLNKPRIFVIKKNVKVLNELKEYLSQNEGIAPQSSLLIVDDECDYASLNTSKDKRTAINGLIAELFKLFKTTTYVGYTATPFANIFVNPDDDNDYIDLFPKDFIVLLEDPDNYIGGVKFFRKWKDEEKKNYQIFKNSYGPRIKLLNESENSFIPTIHKKNYLFDGIPESLKESICYFLIANCIRTLRGDKYEHRSMLINVSRFNDVQENLKYYVQEYINDMKNTIEQTYMRKDLDKFLNSDITKTLYKIWEKNDFYKFERRNNQEIISDPAIKEYSWNDIQLLLNEEVKKIEISIANYKHKNDRYDYDSKKSVGARVIVIGGFSLSRGLTLEGLMISYYNRHASAYDVLLQMGRWFGYRPNYEDLCKIFMTQINVDCFNAAIDATEELKNSFREMANQNKTPLEFGLSVKKSPESLETSLLVTARNKCRNSSSFKKIINLSNKVIDTSKIYKDYESNEINKHAVECLIEQARLNSHIFVVSESDSNYKMLRDVERNIIVEFLLKTKFPYANKKYEKDGIISFINKSIALKKWDVVFAKGNRNEAPQSPYGDSDRMVLRQFASREKETFLRIADRNNRLADPNLFRIGLSKEQYNSLKNDSFETALKAEKYLDFVRNPLLIIYPISLKAPENNIEEIKIYNSFKNNPLIGIALGFPGTIGKNEECEYLYNKIKIQQIINEDDLDDDEEFEDDI